MPSTRTEAGPVVAGSAATPPAVGVVGLPPASPTTPGWEVAPWQLPLAQLCDSALPTGAFSHSLGLETYVTEGTVSDETSFVAWMRTLLATQLTYSEGLGLRLAWAAAQADDEEGLARLDRLLVVQAVPAQVRRAGSTMGRRMLTIAVGCAGGPWLARYGALVRQGRCQGHPAIVLALVGHDLGAPVGAVVAAYLQSTVTSLTQNAVRAVPLGQDAGQRAVAAVRADVMRAVDVVARTDPAELGAACPGIEIAQMRHERQRARMFMS